VQAAQRGAPRDPPRTGRTCPQPAQAAQRCLHASHHGRPVAVETVHAASRPQIEHVSTFTGRQAGHSGPSPVRTATGRRRPQARHDSWLAGSTVKQWGHKARPCSSRVAASRTAPHREHGWARDLAVQLRQSHCPSIGLCKWMTR